MLICIGKQTQQPLANLNIPGKSPACSYYFFVKTGSLLRTPKPVFSISSFINVASGFDYTILLKTISPFLVPIGITISKWISFGKGISYFPPRAACIALLAITCPYWYIETMLFVSFIGVKQTSPKLKIFSYVTGLSGALATKGWIFVTYPYLFTKIYPVFLSTQLAKSPVKKFEGPLNLKPLQSKVYSYSLAIGKSSEYPVSRWTWISSFFRIFETI